MAVAAISYRELARDHPAIVDRIVALMAEHPEPGPFKVAIGRTEGRHDGSAILVARSNVRFASVTRLTS